MNSFFCPCCGIKTDGNTIRLTYEDVGLVLTCPCCGCYIKFDIVSRATKTDEEIEKAFQDTPLTDSQRGTKRFKKK